MHKSILLKSLLILCYSCVFNTTLWAKTAELAFDDSFYMTTICTDFKTKEDNQYCNDGYLLKSETLANGQVKETVSLDGIGHYGWNHIDINKIDADTYHVYVGCGNPCGANMLFGRDDKEQSFGREFDYDLNTKCSVSYDTNKRVWVASKFFLNKEILLSLTKGTSKYAAYPNYDVEFDKEGNLLIKEYFSEEVIKTLPNPCIANKL